jgi:hypothetical protein
VDTVTLPLPSTRLTHHQSHPYQVILPHTFGHAPSDFDAPSFVTCHH